MFSFAQLCTKWQPDNKNLYRENLERGLRTHPVYGQVMDD